MSSAEQKGTVQRIGRPPGAKNLDPLTRRLKALLRNIEGRCGRTPTMGNFDRYAGRGIRNFLTLDDLRALWERDGAGAMQRPSIDRRESNDHYTVENARFIELSENSKRVDRRRQCANCKEMVHRTRTGLCRACYFKCIKCGGLRNVPMRRVCDNCRFETRPCGWCNQPVTRDISLKAGSGTVVNKQWFCSKQHFYKKCSAGDAGNVAGVGN